jgi:hypothetical protein
LEAVCPGYGKEIASVLTGKASDDITRKVEKTLRSKKKKEGHHMEIFSCLSPNWVVPSVGDSVVI